MHSLFLASSSTLPHEIMELLDVRHRVLLHLLLEDAPPVLNTVQVWRHTWPLHHLHLQQQGSCHLGSVVWVVDMLENCFWREGIIFCFRMSQYMLESMFPSMNRSSLVPAVVMQPQTTMLPPPCLTVSKAQFSWYSSPGRRHTCWTPSEPNKFTLHSSDHRHGSSNSCSWSGCLQQTICRLFLWASFRRGFLLGQRPCKPTCCSVWRMVWAPTSWASTSATSKTMLSALMRLFLKPASASDTQHKDSTSLIDPCEACSEWKPFWKTSVWPWPQYCNSVPGCYWTSYILRHLCGEQQF